MVEKVRCAWVGNDPLMLRYHDEEWGVPLHNDEKLFEFLVLGGVQAGLSWNIVLKKREGFRKAFDGFSVLKVSRYAKKDIDLLVKNPSIIRNKLKITAAVSNAQKFLQVQEEFGSFDKYIWKFVNDSTISNKIENPSDYQTTTPESDEMSRDLKKRGFKFVGSTICYAFMQAVGMVNDHSVYCFRSKRI